MRPYFRIPLLFLSIAALLGLFLRWQFVSPTPGIRYTFFLHSHSHVMFLGWVFNVLFLSSVEYHIPDATRRKNYLRLFFLLQALVLAMMISFPLQGYGAYSITFSTLHTLGVVGFIFVFLRQTRSQITVSIWFARVAWAFFLISTIGPFGLGYLMANDMGHTVWYNASIYYYLHFQYNGFFTFGIFSLFFQLLERKKISFPARAAKIFGWWMCLACIPAFVLSILYAEPGIAFNVTGALAATVQLLAVIFLFSRLAKLSLAVKQMFNPVSRKLLTLVTISLLVKTLLQLLSAHPGIARLAFEFRPVTIAYLHLVLVGLITFFLIAWYLEMGLLNVARSRLPLILLAVGFVGSEICLAVSPLWTSLMGNPLSSSSVILFFSLLMSLAMVMIPLAFNRADKRNPRAGVFAN